MGDEHAPKLAPSKEHAKVSEPADDVSSLPANPKLADVTSVEPDGPELIDVLGAVVSAGGAGTVTVQLRVATEASVLPASSVARTENVCAPTGRPL